MNRKLKKVMLLLLVVLLITPSSWITLVAGAETTDKTVYHETFEDGMGVAKQAGDALLEMSMVDFEGNENGKAVYINGRTHDYDGIDVEFSTVDMENGKTYLIDVLGYVGEDESFDEGAEAYLQIPSGNYPLITNSPIMAGESFLLSGEYTVAEEDSQFRIQTNQLGEQVSFYVGSIRITEKVESQSEEETVTEEKVAYHETFSSGIGIATQAGSTLEAVSDLHFDGNDDGHAVYVKDRTNDWHGIDIPFSAVNMEDSYKYSIIITGFVDDGEDVPDGANALLQNIDSYEGLYVSSELQAGEPFILSGQYTVNTEVDRALRIQTNGAGAEVPFYIGDILIIEEGKVDEEEEVEEPWPPAEEFTTITFEDGELSGFEGRAGTETLTVTDEANYTEDGTYSLKVEDRANNWHGPSLDITPFVEAGSEYQISAMVQLLSPDSAQLQLSTQVGDGDGASYNNIQGKTVSKGDGWVKLEGTYRYTSMGNGHLSIYIESNNATASYYIDDITFEKTDAEPIEIEDELIPIKDVYKDYFLIGNAVSMTDFVGVRGELLQKHHNLVTAENAMKPGYAYNENREFDFTAEDELVATALENDYKIHGHVLVWHQQSAEWLHTDDDGNLLEREEALNNLRTHVQTTVEHFGESVISWDVVNEAMMDGPPNPSDWKASLRKSEWYHSIGEDFVEQAFRAAKEVIDENGWDIKLYYNDYNDDNQNKAEAIYQMVKEINENYASENDGELLIDGVGMQGHYNLNTNPENVRRSLEKFISLGVEVGVTELDITAGDDGVLTEQEANAQGYLYAQLFKMYKEHAEHISRVTFWGLNDATSWRAERNPLLFDRNMKAKPAYYAVIDPEKFIEEHEVDDSDARHGQAFYGTPEIDGEIDEVWSSAPELQINQYQTAWNGANGVGRVLWDEEYLYVLIQVSDSQLDQSSENPWEQDSVEVFLDENNSKSTFYQEGHGQYRVNFENETSFNPVGISEGFESATHVVGNGYTVELKIPFNEITPTHDTKIGFDLQINDAQNGSRQSVAAWNDLSGQGFQDPSVFGVLTLVGEETVTPEPEPEVPNDSVKEVTMDDLVTTDRENVYEVSEIANSFKFTKELLSSLSSQAKIKISNGEAKAVVPVKILLTEAEYVIFSFGEDVSDDYQMEGAKAVSGVYHFSIVTSEGDDIKEFGEEHITLSFKVSASDIEKVAIWYIDEELEVTPFETTIVSETEVETEVNHFSVYGVFEGLREGPEGPEG
ncbi:endo-1,4-beta-xylanase, partial [Alkalihalobacillus trypoxylicola]